MNLQTLLSFFQTLDRAHVEYTVVGDLATTLRGNPALTECLEIAVMAESMVVRDAILAAWPGTCFMEGAPVTIRALPPETPFYLDVLTQRVITVATVELGGVRIQALSETGDEARPPGRWFRPGFTLGERIAAVQSLVREIVPIRPRFRGVRKYRSIEAAKADRITTSAHRSPNS